MHLAEDPSYMRLYSAASRYSNEYRQNGHSWFKTQHKRFESSYHRYFSAEFGLHTSIPIYSGGLGILAGDIARKPVISVCPWWEWDSCTRKDIFGKRITPEGWQEAAYAPFNRAESPIHPALTPSGDACRITVEIGSRVVAANGLESASSG